MISLLLAVSAILACHTESEPQTTPADSTSHCAAIQASVQASGFGDRVTVSCEDAQAIIRSDTYPSHTKMTGIVGTNEQVPIPADYAAPIPLSPTLSEQDPITRDAALGVAVNGVPIYDYTGGGEMTQEDLAHHQAQHDTLQTEQLDACGGHAGRGDDYHYHVKPSCMIEEMDNAGDAAIIGWAFDGFPIYGDRNPDGSEIPEGTLGLCNGQPDETYGYRYHSSEGAPYILQCLQGVVSDLDALPRVSPLSAQGGGRGLEAGTPPQGGVEGLTFTESDDGQRSMDYSYQGQDYYIRYRPADQEGCYVFETKTVTNTGESVGGTFCR